ncbi:MAG: hypothetical protein ACRELF_27045, partial [Gemmataceae bacterium]
MKDMDSSFRWNDESVYMAVLVKWMHCFGVRINGSIKPRECLNRLLRHSSESWNPFLIPAHAALCLYTGKQTQWD